MIYLGILELSEKISDVYADKLGDAVKNRINEAKNPESRIARLGAYSLLVGMYDYLKGECCFQEKMPQICYTGGGKPYFLENNSLQNAPKFNISHDLGLAVCVISNSCEVGVDVQSMPKRRLNLSRIADRFFAPLRRIDPLIPEEPEDDELEVSVLFFTECGGELSLSELDKLSLKRVRDALSSSDFLSKWTLLEAVLKMSGGGFGDSAAANELLANSDTVTFSLKHNGDEYFISAAVGK